MLLRAAEIYEDRLSDPGAAREVLASVVGTYDGTEAAGAAARELDRLGDR
jgi:hypothetical protein